jgi:hypothetical protein
MACCLLFRRLFSFDFGVHFAHTACASDQCGTDRGRYLATPGRPQSGLSVVVLQNNLACLGLWGSLGILNSVFFAAVQSYEQRVAHILYRGLGVPACV